MPTLAIPISHVNGTNRAIVVPSRATRDDRGLRWIQAEHRVRPELLVAQTGYMQGAAGVGMWLLRLDATQRGRTTFVRFPDTPWTRP